MAWLGMALIVAGIVVVAPQVRPGGGATRIVSLWTGGLVKTPGYQNKPDDDSRRSTVIRVIAGLVLLAAGIIVIVAF